jgi:hypothetical protein
MATCFVIQPFDSGKYDKRYKDIYKPSIEAAGLEAYRVDHDPSVLVPIDSIEKGIRQSAICLADISADNANVWYELGFAFAATKPVVMVCSQDRSKYPFDIQHRSIIPYMADAPSDFESLRNNLTAKLKALYQQAQRMNRIAEDTPVTPVEGLSSVEVIVVAAIAGETDMPTKGVSVWSATRQAERAGVNKMGFNVALRRLTAKRLLSMVQLHDDDGNPYDGIAIDDTGWEWIDRNDHLFTLQKAPKVTTAVKSGDDAAFNDDIPF